MTQYRTATTKNLSPPPQEWHIEILGEHGNSHGAVTIEVDTDRIRTAKELWSTIREAILDEMAHNDLYQADLEDTLYLITESPDIQLSAEDALSIAPRNNTMERWGYRFLDARGHIAVYPDHTLSLTGDIEDSGVLDIVQIWHLAFMPEDIQP